MQVAIECVTGGLAASGATLFSNPLEVVKTRMQLQGELQSRGSYQVHYRNVFHAFYTIGKNDGLLALQKGLVPGVLYQFVMNGLRLGTFSCFRSMGLTKNKDGSVSATRSVIFAAISGTIGAFVGSPFYMIKTQLQSQAVSADIAVGHQHNIKSIPEAFRLVYKEHGLSGLWRGYQASLARVSIGSAVQLTSFSKIKQGIINRQMFQEGSIMIPFCSSMMAGVFVALAMTPFDVVTTRMYNQPVDKSGKGIMYKHLGDVFVKIFRTEGFLGFYKGLGSHYFRVGPHTILCLMFWDYLRKAFQL